VKDDFVAEAASYTKQKAGWKYWRELGAVAACVAAILVSVKTVEYLPIERTTESMVTVENSNQHNSSTKEMYEEALIPESAVAESVVIEQKENSGTNGIMEDVKTEDKQEKEAQTEELIDSSNVLEPIQSVQSQSCLVNLSAEEILDQGNDIFRGVVTELQVYHVTEKINQYFTVVTVEVTDSIRGKQQNGESCKIYLPVAEVQDMIMVNSVSGDLDKLEVGSSAIFMPRTATENTGLGPKHLGEWLCYADFADYYFSDAIRYLFLETENGVSYEKSVYNIPGENVTLDDVAEYLRKMLE
jgi:hypothetical protein